MKALVWNGIGKIEIEERAKPASPGAGRCHRENRQDHDLRHGSSHPEGSCRYRRFRGASWAMKVSAWSNSVGDARDGLARRAIGFLFPAFPPAASARIAARGCSPTAPTGGWILGNKIDGTQAEYVRIPHANTSLYPLPEGVDEDAW